MRDATDISSDQTIIQRNLARLRIPEKRQINNEVLDNYNWTIKIVRRRKKMTLSQLAHGVGVDAQVINQIEQGRLPKNFKEVFSKIENFLEVKLLKEHDKPIKIDEHKILEDVGKKIGIKIKPKNEEPIWEKGGEYIEEELEPTPVQSKEKEEKLQRVARGEMDFSRRMNLQNVTLNDLVDAKRAKEKRENRAQAEKRSEIIGNDIDIDDDDFDLDKV
jgi:ribosome-binding protein aMBF1 (putative translation factor)